MLIDSVQEAVVLCKCHGKVSESLPMSEICQFLEQRQPGLRVVIHDDLCQPHVLSTLVRERGIKPVVVGACSRLNVKINILAHSYSARVVGLLKEIESSYDSVELSERIRVLLWAQVRRKSETEDIPQQGRKLGFAKPQGEISRRELFEMLMPEYQVIPYIESDKCVGGGRCHICQGSCSFSAVVIEDDVASIDGLKCRGCGACVAVCPHNAISYPTFTNQEFERELEGLLLTSRGVLDPRIIALVCHESKECQFRYPANVFPVEIPCLAMASCHLMLRIFDLGAQGLALIARKDKCLLGLKLDEWKKNIQFLQELFRVWGIGSERIRLFETDDIEQDLAEFAQEMDRLDSTPMRLFGPTSGGGDLVSLVSSLGKKFPISQDGVISASYVPFGKLAIDSSRCTGCGLCALDCPTYALVFLQEGDENGYQMLFHQDSCIGCGQCVKGCPEECLHLENILELSKLGSLPVTLFEDDILMCQECGAPIAPRAMIDKLRDRIAAAGGTTHQFQRCPMCRIQAEFSSISSRSGM